MLKGFKKFLVFLFCAVVFRPCICVAVPPPERRSRPMINQQELIRVFGNSDNSQACDRDEYGNYQIVYHQNSDSRWDYRSIQVMNYAGAFADNGRDLGLLAALKDLFGTMVDIENQSLQNEKERVAKMKKISGWAMAVSGAATASTIAEATGLLDDLKDKISNEQREKIISSVGILANRVGIKNIDMSETVTEEVMKAIFWGLGKFATFMGSHPYVKYSIMAIGAATFLLSAPFYLKTLAEEKKFERDAQNVSELFQNVLKFLSARSYENGNLICFAIDRRIIPWYNIFQENVGTWIGPLNWPRVPNAIADARYYPKFLALAEAMNAFVENEGIPRGLRIDERRNVAQPESSSDPCLLM